MPADRSMRVRLPRVAAIRRPLRATCFLGGLVLAVAACAPASSNTGPSTAADSAAPVEGCEATAPTEGRVGAGYLPDLELPCLGDGPVVDLADLTGRPTLVNLWASWCGPCREEMPMLQQAFRDRGDTVRFLGVDTRDTTAAAISFLTDSRVGYPQVVDDDGALLDDLGLPGLPVTLAVDPAGRIITTHIGQMTPEVLQDVIQQLTAAATPSPGS